MRLILYLGLCLLSILLGTAASQDSSPVNECLVCHLDLDEEYAKPAEIFPEDVHALSGFTCADCHGGDPTSDDMDEAKDTEAGFIGVPIPKEVPSMCEKCHSDPVFMQQYNPSIPVDQVAKYVTSEHGRALSTGDRNVATCSSCHSIHNMLPNSDPRSPVYPTNVATTCNTCHGDTEIMQGYDIDTDMFDEYSNSIHNYALMEKGDLSAPTCNDCHGNHGAIPPGVRSVKMVCGLCHPNNQDIFEQSKMITEIEKKGFHSCVICHSNHKILHTIDDMVGMESDGVCKKCHEEGDVGALHGEIIRSALEELNSLICRAKEKVAEAENLGIEVEDALFHIQSANEVLIKSRTMIHSLNGEEVKRTTLPGLEEANRAHEASVSAIIDFRNRRIGLGISTIIITFLVVMLIVYIKKIEKK